MKIFTTLAFLVCAFLVNAQQYKMQNSEIIFESTAEKENISAKNSESIGVIDFEESKFSFKVSIMKFIFPISLMQEHFNENYMESETFPHATYKGSFTGEVNLKKDGDYRVQTKGELTIHGVTKEITISAVVSVNGKEITMHAEFPVRPEDYGIKIPGDMSGNIAQELKVSVSSELVKK